MLLLALNMEESRRRLEVVLLLVLLLQYHNSIRDRHYLHRAAIVQPRESPWRKLYEHADDSSFLHMTGLNRLAFTVLLGYVFDLEAIVHCRRPGRPRSLSPDGYLGLLLFYLGSMMTNKHLCLIFGITVFDPEYVRIESLQGYDRIAQYYFRPGEYVSDEDSDEEVGGNESE